MAIKIEVNGGEAFVSLEKALLQLANKLDKAGGIGSSDNNSSSTSNPKNPEEIKNKQQSAQATESANGKFASLTQQLVTVTAELSKFSASLKSASSLEKMQKYQAFSTDRKTYDEFQDKEKQLREQSRQEQIKFNQDKQEQKSSQRWSNIGAGILSASVMAALYQSGNIGATVGSSAKSINVGANSYNDFMKNYYNNRLDTQRSMGTMGIIGAAGAAGSMFGLPGMIAGAAVGGVANYALGNYTEKQKAFNEMASNQDILSYRLSAHGTSDIGAGRMNLKSNVGGKDLPVKLTDLQNLMATNPEYQPYLQYLSTVSSGSRQDMFNNQGERDPTRRIQGQANFAKQVAQSALLTGTSDLGGLSKTVTNLASMSGQDPTKVLIDVTKKSMEYGGDMVENTNKMVQLMQNNAMGYGGASNLAFKYQYNDAEIQNQQNMRQAPYMNKVVGKLLMQVAGASEGEISSGRWNEGSNAAYRNAPTDIGSLNLKYILQQQSYASLGQNPYVSAAGAVRPGQVNNAEMTAQMKDFNDTASKNLTQMMVQSDNVYITAAKVTWADANSTAMQSGGLSGMWNGVKDAAKGVDSAIQDVLGLKNNLPAQNRSGTGTNGTN